MIYNCEQVILLTQILFSGFSFLFGTDVLVCWRRNRAHVYIILYLSEIDISSEQCLVFGS